MQTICFGCDDYSGKENDLAVCKADARAFAKLFGGPVIADRKVTRTNFVSSVKKWAASVPVWKGPIDYGFASFSGHGTFLPDDNGDEADGRDECLVMADLRTVRDDEFKQLLDARRASARLVIVTDSCFSGTVYRRLHIEHEPLRARYLAPANIGRNDYKLRKRATEKTAALTNVVHFAACSDFEFAYEGEHNGVLTGALVEAYDPQMQIGEWFNAAAKIVAKSGYPQHPQINCSASALKWPVPVFSNRHSIAA